MKPLVLATITFWLVCCSTDKEKELFDENSESSFNSLAQVIEVTVSGEPLNYTIATTVKSSDTGCEQYADWWEIIDLNGNLIYRRILTHSHVDEQPFSRSGTSIDLADTTEIYVRAHMNTTGYSPDALKGSVANGFEPSLLDPDFAEELETTAPLPDGCAF